MTTANVAASVQIVREIAKEALADAIDMIKIIETLKAGNAHQIVKASIAARVDPVAECIYRALWSRLVVIVARAYADNTRPGDRHAQYAFDLLKDSTVRSTAASGWQANALNEAIALWLKCRGDHRRKAIQDFRDKQVAHWGTLRSVPPVINDLFAVTEATATALERLAQGTGLITLGLDSQIAFYRSAAVYFWQAQTSLPPADQSGL